MTMLTLVVDNAVVPGDDGAECTFQLTIASNVNSYNCLVTWAAPPDGDPPTRNATFNIPVSMIIQSDSPAPFPDGTYVVKAASLDIAACGSPDAVLAQAPIGFSYSLPDGPSGDQALWDT